MFAFMCSMGLWKTHSVIGSRASGLSLTKPSWLSQHDQPTALHTLFCLLETKNTGERAEFCGGAGQFMMTSN